METKHEELYQIYDVCEQSITENSLTLDGCKHYIACYWDEDADSEQWNKIMNAQSLDELNNYAEGLDFIIERMGQS